MSSEREWQLRRIMARVRDENNVRVVPNKDHFARAPIYRAVFDLVSNSKDWKAPVVAEIRDDDPMLGLIIESIRFMTATEPDIFITGTCEDGHRMLTLVSEGYRNGPAGP